MPEASGQDTKGRKPRGKRFLAVYRRIDGAIFSVEAGVVTAATLAMTFFVFLDLSFNFVKGLSLNLFPAGFGFAIELSGNGGRAIGGAFALLLIWAIILAGVRRQPRLKDLAPLVRLLISTAMFLAVFGFIVMLVKVESRWVFLTLTGLGALISGFRVFGAPKIQARLVTIWVIAVGLLLAFSLNAPQGYSWAQTYALVLLLWTGFIGASMATSAGRHLKVDAVRKSLSESKLPTYNAISYGVAAIATGALCILAYAYLSARFEPPEEGQSVPQWLGEVFATIKTGEIPDWVKVLAIPVSLTFVTVRFSMRSLFGWMGHAEETAAEFDLPPEEDQAGGSEHEETTGEYDSESEGEG